MGYKGGSSGGGGKDFPKPPKNDDGYVGICTAYYPSGTHAIEWAGETNDRPQVSLVWEIEEQDPDGKPFQLVERNTDSLFKNARLKKRIEAHIRRPLTDDEEENGFDLDLILGRPVMVYVNDDGYVENVERLQDASRAIPVRRDYARVPGLALHWMKKAQPGTVFPWYGYWDGEKACYVRLHDEDVKALGDRVQKNGDEQADQGEPDSDGTPEDGDPF